MPRPPGLEIDAIVDASVQAHAAGVVERSFSASQLPRLSEAGVVEPVDISVSVRFSTYEGQVALTGNVRGSITMICQRCLQPAAIAVDDEFRLLIVDDEGDQVAETGGFEPIDADPARLDLRWLAEEQTLLNVPLVAKHEDVGCGRQTAQPDDEQPTGQRPFANLRSLLRDR